MQREQAIELLREIAPKHVAAYGYLPANETFAKVWMPPQWAIEAVIVAGKSAEPLDVEAIVTTRLEALREELQRSHEDALKVAVADAVMTARTEWDAGEAARRAEFEAKVRAEIVAANASEQKPDSAEPSKTGKKKS